MEALIGGPPVSAYLTIVDADGGNIVSSILLATDGTPTLGAVALQGDTLVTYTPPASGSTGRTAFQILVDDPLLGTQARLTIDVVVQLRAGA